MTEFVENTIARWLQFESYKPAIAKKLSFLALAVAEEMPTADSIAQIKAMRDSEHYLELKEHISLNANELGISAQSDREIARWIRVVCFQLIG